MAGLLTGGFVIADCHVALLLSMNMCRHCEQSEAIQAAKRHGLPRFARSDKEFVQGPCAVTAGYGGLAMTSQGTPSSPIAASLRSSQ